MNDQDALEALLEGWEIRIRRRHVVGERTIYTVAIRRDDGMGGLWRVYEGPDALERPLSRAWAGEIPDWKEA